MSRRKIKTLYEKEQEDLLREKMLNNKIHRGDIYFFDKVPTVGVEQEGGRPGIVVSNNACNNSSEFLLVCYLTTQQKTNLPTHVPIMCEQQSICLCEQVHTLSKLKMKNYYCTATPEEMAEIDKALVLTLGIDLNNILPDEYSETIEKLKLKEIEYQTKINALNKDFNSLTDDFEKVNAYNFKLEKEIYELTQEKKILNKDLNDATNTIETLNKIVIEKTDIIKKLEDEKYKFNKQMINIENIPEYIRVCAERDVYKELYKELLNKKIGD